MFASYRTERKTFLLHIRRCMSLTFATLLAISCLLTFGCKKGTNRYPSIPTDETFSDTETVASSTVLINQTIELTIASPLSYETCQYIAKLYYAKTNGLLGEGVTGDTVDLEYLDGIDLPFVLNVYGTGDTGCNASTLSKWKESGDIPDIFLADEFDLVVSSGYAMPITEYLSEQTLLSADRTYTDMVSSFFMNQEQYGIPYQTSAAVLYCDMEVLNLAGVPAVSYQQSRQSLEGILEKVALLNEEEAVALPFYQVSSMVPYLPCSLYASEYLSASDENTRNQREYTDSVRYIQNLMNLGYCYESLSDEEIELLFGGMSPILSRKVGVWCGTTDELPRYDNYMPNTLNLMQYPSSDEDQYSSPLLISYPFCISSSCEHPREACDLASFFALDEDAILLTSRLQSREGFLPSLSSPSVWKSVTGRQKYGMYLIQYYDLMNQAVYIPAVSASQTFQQDLNYISDEVLPLLVEELEEQT